MAFPLDISFDVYLFNQFFTYSPLSCDAPLFGLIWFGLSLLYIYLRIFNILVYCLFISYSWLFDFSFFYSIVILSVGFQLVVDD